MKGSILILPFAVLLALVVVGNAAAVGSPNTGAAYQRLLDSDNDGIPNCEDPDYVPPRDGTGQQIGRTQAAASPGRFTFRYTWIWRGPFTLGLWIPSVGVMEASGYGPGDGTGNDGDGPADGTGYGPGPAYKK